jgi:hypothetical protein
MPQSRQHRGKTLVNAIDHDTSLGAIYAGKEKSKTLLAEMAEQIGFSFRL